MLARYCERTRILEIDGDLDLQRRAEKHDHARSIPLARLERVWKRRDIDLRERTLWRLLYETAARANAVLGLDIEDLDLAGKRARTRSKATSTCCSSARGSSRAAATPDRRPCVDLHADGVHRRARRRPSQERAVLPGRAAARRGGELTAPGDQPGRARPTDLSLPDLKRRSPSSPPREHHVSGLTRGCCVSC